MGPTLQRARFAGGVACLMLASALAGTALARRDVAGRGVVVRVEGVPVDPGTDARAAAEAIARAWGERPLTLRIGDEAISGTRAGFGGRVDVEALSARIAQARDPDSPMRRWHARRSPDAPLDLPLPIGFDQRETLLALLERKDHLDVRPRDARIEPRTGAVLGEREGLALDVHGTLDALADAMRRGAPDAVARIAREPPRRTARALEGVRIEALLAAFETRYARTPEQAERTHNLRVAASRIDGSVLLPGETFDFDAVVGERSEANGFRPAPQIAAGEIVDGVGGGTCQIAGTLHAAAFFAGLPIVERSPHSRPSTYLWMGLDAAVAYGSRNLRFTNDLPFPIVLGMTVEGGVVRAEVRGARASRRVTLLRRIEEITPFRERIEHDPTLPSGVRVLRQRGVPGFRITRFRIVRDVARRQARRQRLEDTYPPTDRIVRIGTGPPAPPGYVPPPDDEHPEYLADEVLLATQGVGIEGLEVVRRAGRTSTPGWTGAFVAPAR